MRKYSHIILTFLLLLIFAACDDSLGTDPDYKTTIFDKDTLYQIDTVIVIDTVLTDDSLRFKFKIDSLITYKDSLGNVVDSLTKILSGSTFRPVAPRFSLIIDSVLPKVTYKVFDTVTKIVTSSHYPDQINFDALNIEMDTNLNRNRAWIDFTLDGRIDKIDITENQEIYLNTSSTKMDSVHIYNRYTLGEGQSNNSHITTTVLPDRKDVSLETIKNINLEFKDYLFDNKSRINGFSILVNIELSTRVTGATRQCNYEYVIYLRYP